MSNFQIIQRGNDVILMQYYKPGGSKLKTMYCLKEMKPGFLNLLYM